MKKDINQLIQKKEYEKAEKLLKNLYDKNEIDYLQLHQLAFLNIIKSNNEEAINLLKKSIEKNPNYPNSYSDLGSLYLKNNQIYEAKKYFLKSLDFNENLFSSLNNLGLIYKNQREYKLSIKYFLSALNVNPKNYLVVYNLAQLFDEIEDYDKAKDFYIKTINLNPSYGNAIVGFYNLLLKIFEWRIISKLEPKLKNFGVQSYQGGDPLTFLYLEEENYTRKLRAINFFNSTFRRDHVKLKPQNNKKLRIGYISNNFIFHPVSFLISGVIKKHNRKEFEIYGYSINTKKDQITEKISNSFDVYRDISLKSDDEAANIIRSDNLDFIIDLMGYSAGSRMGILSQKVAPIQISYLAYPSTTGSNQMDYFLADKHVIPETEVNNFTEKVINIPGTFMCFDDTTKISEKVIKNQFYNFKKNSFIMVAFHRPQKLNLKTVLCWCEILNSIENSFLWIRKPNKYAMRNLLEFFEMKDIDRTKIIFADREPSYEKHLSRYKVGHLLLDTFNYNGHTTTIEALWSGLPVITLQGKNFASRVSASILRSIGLEELIAKTINEYKQKVIFYSKNPNEINVLKNKLSKLKSNGELFNTETFTIKLENVLKDLKR